MSRWAQMTDDQKRRMVVRVAKWAAANPDKVKRNKRRWQKAHPEETRANTLQWQKDNPERANAACRRWSNKNPGKNSERRARRRAALVAATVPLTLEEQATVLGVYATARAMSALAGEPYHVDHIKPLSKGGLHHPSNLQVLRGVDNLRKGAKL